VTGAECLLRTLAANGVDTCFMNPGTSEMHFVAALDRVRDVRGVLCRAARNLRTAPALTEKPPRLGNSVAVR
jgi:hypothetical protein